MNEQTKPIKKTAEIIPFTAPTPFVLLQQGIEKGLDVVQMEKLMDLQERWENKQAKKTFLIALSKFQSECPVIPKKSPVKFNGKLQYVFADLPTIIETIKDCLRDAGLSYRWETEDKKDDISITCVLGHIDGHETFNTMSGPADSSGSKNAIQARGSTRQYLQRYTLIGCLGLTSADTDDDGGVDGKDINELKAEYLALIDPLIQKDPEKYSKLRPENWNNDETIPNYLIAIKHVKTIK